MRKFLGQALALAMVGGWGLIGEAIAQPTAAPVFRVEVAVADDDANAIDRVRALQPDAFHRPEQGIIQVGLFSDRELANSISEELQTAGLPARVVAGQLVPVATLNGTPVERVESEVLPPPIPVETSLAEPVAIDIDEAGAVPIAVEAPPAPAPEVVPSAASVPAVVTEAEPEQEIKLVAKVAVAPEATKLPQPGVRVEIPNPDPQVLALVRTVEPGAFIRTQDGVIQAGLFDSEENAKAFALRLQELGVESELVAIGSEYLSPIAIADIEPAPKSIKLQKGQTEIYTICVPETQVSPIDAQEYSAVRCPLE